MSSSQVEQGHSESPHFVSCNDLALVEMAAYLWAPSSSGVVLSWVGKPRERTNYIQF